MNNKSTDQRSSTNQDCEKIKRPYQGPQFVVYGSIPAMTQNMNPSPGRADNPGQGGRNKTD